MPINDYTDCVDQRARHLQTPERLRSRILNIIEEEMKKPYGDFQIGAMMGLINLRTIIQEMEV